MGTDYAQLLPVYYQRLFPAQLMFDWLAGGGGKEAYFSHREFSFTLKDDVYIRYLSFESAAELQREVVKRLPYKIDIGAYYTLKPKNHKMARPGGFRALEKELVFDIDMTDYDDVRYCCSGADICPKCWRLMTIAIRLVDEALRTDFGFHHLLWVYSGRRGIHCWVCDDHVRKFDATVRAAVCEYLSLPKVVPGKKGVLPAQPHPLFYKAISVIERHFARFCEEQKLFSGEKQIEDFFKLLPEDDDLVARVRVLMEDEKIKPREKWDHIRKLLINYSGGGSKVNKLDWEVMLHYCYPRLDVNVSTGVNHLLKSPFCAHPKTSNVCVPIDTEKLESFDPFLVPNLGQLNEELNSYSSHKPHDHEEDAENESKKKVVNEYQFTSLKKYIDFFTTFIKSMQNERASLTPSLRDSNMEF